MIDETEVIIFYFSAVQEGTGREADRSRSSVEILGVEQ